MMEKVQWADGVEQALRNSFAERSLVDRFHARGYWRIHELAPTPEGPARLIRAEVEAQTFYLGHIVDRLRAYQSLKERPGHIVVPDTNALLHYNRLDKIDWAKVIGKRPVRLVVPLLVLDELDDKKYLGSDKIIKRARSALKPFEELRSGLEGRNLAELPTFDVTAEYLVDDEDHIRLANPDEELLGRARFLKQVTDQQVTVVTADYGVRARAVAPGLSVAHMLEEYARDAL
jgi:rRNA-processing protein FCF1